MKSRVAVHVFELCHIILYASHAPTHYIPVHISCVRNRPRRPPVVNLGGSLEFKVVVAAEQIKGAG